jgi:hypothetical protein
MDGLYVIDTVATITAVHQAFYVASQLPLGAERDQLTADANSALSICTYYVRYPRVQAKKAHYDAVQRLLANLAECTCPNPQPATG